MVCLDTSFIIDLLKGRSNVKDMMNRLEKGSKAVAVVSPTIMELVTGANLSSKISKEKERIIEFLSGLLIFDFDKKSAFIAGDIEADLLKKGERIETEDIMIGAIVKNNNEILLTGNRKHFERIKDLKIESY